MILRAVHPLPAATKPGSRPHAATSKIAHGYISGVVTDRHGHPLQGICVIVLPFSGGGGVSVATSRTGTYRSLPQVPGTYEVSFQAGCGNTGDWLPQTYDDQPFFGLSPTPVVVSAGHTTTGIDARLQEGGEIFGRVTNEKGAAVAGICVTVSTTTATSSSSYQAASDSDGHYRVKSLPPDAYTVAFAIGCGSSANFAPQWYNKAATASRAVAVKIVSGTVVSGINAVLVPGAAITGKVTEDSPNGHPLSGICVVAGTEGSQPNATAEATTRSNGTYRIIALGTGSYLLQFETGCGNSGNWLGQQYSRPVRAVDGQTVTGIDAALQPGGEISGNVTDTGGRALSGICLQVEQISGRGGIGSGASSPVTSDGAYAVTQLTTGRYTLEFSGGCGNGGSFAPQWYHAAANAAAAVAIDVTAGKTTSGIDATMQPGATISGTVRDAVGASAVGRLRRSVEPLPDRARPTGVPALPGERRDHRRRFSSREPCSWRLRRAVLLGLRTERRRGDAMVRLAAGGELGRSSLGSRRRHDDRDQRHDATRRLDLGNGPRREGPSARGSLHRRDQRRDRRGRRPARLQRQWCLRDHGHPARPLQGRVHRLRRGAELRAAVVPGQGRRVGRDHARCEGREEHGRDQRHDGRRRHAERDSARDSRPTARRASASRDGQRASPSPRGRSPPRRAPSRSRTSSPATTSSPTRLALRPLPTTVLPSRHARSPSLPASPPTPGPRCSIWAARSAAP